MVPIDDGDVGRLDHVHSHDEQPTLDVERWVSFRCAITGVPFKVGFAKEDTDARYSVVEIVKETPGRRLGEWLASPKKSAVGRRLVDELHLFDLSGWECPCCGHHSTTGQDHFVHCGRCDELVCGGGFSRTLLGGLRFKCHPQCGNSGRITGSFSMLSTCQPERAGRLRGPALPSVGSKRLLLPQRKN
ncbi:MAG: hypothetical protein AAF714_00425 [Pseudomonadota bacterium]